MGQWQSLALKSLAQPWAEPAGLVLSRRAKAWELASIKRLGCVKRDSLKRGEAPVGELLGQGADWHICWGSLKKLALPGLSGDDSGQCYYWKTWRLKPILKIYSNGAPDHKIRTRMSSLLSIKTIWLASFGQLDVVKNVHGIWRQDAELTILGSHEELNRIWSATLTKRRGNREEKEGRSFYWCIKGQMSNARLL